MGADFVCVTFPKFKVTDEMVKEFNTLVDKVDESLILKNTGYAKGDIKGFFRELLQFENRRDCGTIYLSELNDREHYITGGLSWGDAPTEAFNTLCVLQDIADLVPEIDAKFTEWHKMEVINETKSK